MVQSVDQDQVNKYIYKQNEIWICQISNDLFTLVKLYFVRVKINFILLYCQFPTRNIIKIKLIKIIKAKQVKMSTQYQQIQILRTQNDHLVREIGSQQTFFKKLNDKYEKSLRQLALIVKANQTLKRDYDQLQQKMDGTVQQRSQANKKHLKECIKKQLDELNQTIRKVSQQNDNLQMQKNSLAMKVDSLGLEKSKVEKQMQELACKYETLKTQLENIDHEGRNASQYNKIYELKHKSRLVDQLQEAAKVLQEQKQQVQQQFQAKLAQIEKLWEQWHQFEHQTNRESRRNLIKLELPSSEQQESRNPLKQRRRGSLIYEQGVRLIHQSSKNNRALPKTHPKIVYAHHEEIQAINKRLVQLQKQNVLLRQSMSGFGDTQKVVAELRTLNAQLLQQKVDAQRKFDQLALHGAPLGSRACNHKFVGSSDLDSKSVTNQQDILSVMKSLHQQLSPLRRQLVDLKKEQAQKNIISFNDKANFQVKIIRLQKQTSFYQQHNQLLKTQLNELKCERQKVSQLQNRNQELQQQKNMLEGRLVVVQSLNVTNRTRVGSETYNTLRQFEKRMLLLIQDPNLLKEVQGNHLQQIIAMKAYILQLDQRLKEMGVQNQKLMKKCSHSKQKISNFNLQIKQIQNRQMTKILMLKQKIQAYDKLVDKLTRELEKNIFQNQNNADRNSRVSTQLQFNQVMNLYEQKMMNLGQQIVRIKKDKQNVEVQLKDLRLQLTKKIRQLNNKQRDIVILKTQNINFQNQKNNMDKQLLQLRIQNQFYKQNKQYKDESLQKSRIISKLEQQNYQISYKYEQEYERMRQIYQNQIASLRNNLFQFQKQLNKQRNVNNMSQNLIKMQTQKQEQAQTIVKNTKEKQFQARIEETISSHQKEMKQANSKLSKIEEQKLKITHELQTTISKLVQKLNTQQLRSKELEQQINYKGFQLKQTEEVISKNNYEIQNLRNQNKSNGHYQSQSQHLRTQQPGPNYPDTNSKMNGQLYLKDVEISGLESTIYNLKLQNQRIRSEYEIVERKLSLVESEIKMKSSKLFHLENDARYSANNYDSTLMAKESLLRSYQNQIKSLKYAIEDLKNWNKAQKDQQQNRIRQLQKQIQVKPVSQQYSYNQDNQDNEHLPSSNKSKIQGYKNQTTQLKDDIASKQKIILQLRQQVSNLQSQLKQALSDLQLRSQQQVNRPESRGPGYNQSNSYISASLQQELQSLNSQVLTLRANILTLKDQIQLKESKDSQLRHQIYVLKLQNKRLQKYELGAINSLSRSGWSGDVRHSGFGPRQSGMHAQDPQNEVIINQLRYQLDELKAVNQELIFNESQHVQTIKFLSEEVQMLSQDLKDQRQNQNQANNQTIQDVERLGTIQDTSQTNQIKDMQYGIQQLQKEYQDQLAGLRSRLDTNENELIYKQTKIASLTSMLLKTGVPSENQMNGTQLSPETTYLLSQVERLSRSFEQKEKQLSDANNLSANLQFQQQRYQQNLVLIFLLNVQIESLRKQLTQKEIAGKEQLEQALQKTRMRRITSVMGHSYFQQIKQPKFSHYRLNNYKLPVSQVEPDDNMDNMRLAEVPSYPSQSLLSQSEVSQSGMSTYNIESKQITGDPFKKYYRHTKSIYNPIKFQAKLSPYHAQTVDRSPLNIGSYKKISESQNIESSYDSEKSGLQSNNDAPQQNYNYALRDVNMISSVGNQGDNNGVGKGLNHLQIGQKYIDYQQISQVHISYPQISQKDINYPQITQSVPSFNQFQLSQKLIAERSDYIVKQMQYPTLKQGGYFTPSNYPNPNESSYMKSQNQMNQGGTLSPDNNQMPTYNNDDSTTNYNSSVVSNTGYTTNYQSSYDNMFPIYEDQVKLI